MGPMLLWTYHGATAHRIGIAMNNNIVRILSFVVGISMALMLWNSYPVISTIFIAAFVVIGAAQVYVNHLLKKAMQENR